MLLLPVHGKLCRSVLASDMNIINAIEKNHGLFLRYNELKYLRFEQLIINNNVKRIVNIIPALLCINDKKVPGYVEGKTPMGIFSYEIAGSEETYLKGRFGYETKRKVASPFIMTLAVMGSVGSIAYNKKSDFDYWACVNKNSVSEEVYNRFCKKVDAIQKWAEKEAGVEVHIFINDISNLRINIFAEDDEEGFGSTIGAVLKDEFFRSSIIIAGKTPFWWVLPKFVPDSEYDKIYKHVASKEGGEKYLDIGNLYKISKDDFLGAAIFQLIKALGNPFKSIVKIGILEKYLFSDENSVLLSQKLKSSILRGKHTEGIPDSYLIMFNEVYNYYESALDDKELLKILRQNIYLKIDPQLSKYVGMKNNKNLPYKVAAMFRLVSEWGWTIDQIRDLDDFESWDYNRIIQFWNHVKKFMLLSYQKISREIPNLNLKSKISATDFKLLSSKIKANFSVEPGKIENFITFKDTPNEPYLYIEPKNEGIREKGWRVYKKVKSEGKLEKEVSIRTENDLVMLLAWCSINQIYDPTFSRVYFESGYTHINKNLVIDLLNRIFVMFNSEKIHLKNDSFLKNPRTVRNMVILNFSENNASSINNFSHLYMNTWGEVFLKSYTSMSDLVVIFSKILKDGLQYSMGFDEFCFFVSPEPHKKLYKQIERIFKGAYEFLVSGKDYVNRRFITSLGDSIVYAAKDRGDITVMSFGNYFELLSNISGSSEKYLDMKIFSENNSNLMMLEEIYGKRSAREITIVYEEKQKYLIVYVIDENGNIFTFIKRRDVSETPGGIYRFCINTINGMNKLGGRSLNENIRCFKLEFDRFGKFEFRDHSKKMMQMNYLSTKISGALHVEVVESAGEFFYTLIKDGMKIGPVAPASLSGAAKKLDPLNSGIIEIVDIKFQNLPEDLADSGSTVYFRERYNIEKKISTSI